MTNLMAELVINYIKAGLIGWAVWFVLSVVYMVASFKGDMVLYNSLERRIQTEKTNLNKKSSGWTASGVMRLIFWPYGIIANAVVVDRFVREELKRK